MSKRFRGAPFKKGHVRNSHDEACLPPRSTREVLVAPASRVWNGEASSLVGQPVEYGGEPLSGILYSYDAEKKQYQIVLPDGTLDVWRMPWVQAFPAITQARVRLSSLRAGPSSLASSASSGAASPPPLSPADCVGRQFQKSRMSLRCEVMSFDAIEGTFTVEDSSGVGGLVEVPDVIPFLCNTPISALEVRRAAYRSSVLGDLAASREAAVVLLRTPSFVGPFKKDVFGSVDFKTAAHGVLPYLRRVNVVHAIPRKNFFSVLAEAALIIAPGIPSDFEGAMVVVAVFCDGILIAVRESDRLGVYFGDVSDATQGRGRVLAHRCIQRVRDSEIRPELVWKFGKPACPSVFVFRSFHYRHMPRLPLVLLKNRDTFPVAGATIVRNVTLALADVFLGEAEPTVPLYFGVCRLPSVVRSQGQLLVLDSVARQLLGLRAEPEPGEGLGRRGFSPGGSRPMLNLGRPPAVFDAARGHFFKLGPHSVRTATPAEAKAAALRTSPRVVDMAHFAALAAGVRRMSHGDGPFLTPLSAPPDAAAMARAFGTSEFAVSALLSADAVSIPPATTWSADVDLVCIYGHLDLAFVGTWPQRAAVVRPASDLCALLVENARPALEGLQTAVGGRPGPLARALAAQASVSTERVIPGDALRVVAQVVRVFPPGHLACQVRVNCSLPNVRLALKGAMENGSFHGKEMTEVELGNDFVTEPFKVFVGAAPGDVRFAAWDVLNAFREVLALPADAAKSAVLPLLGVSAGLTYVSGSAAALNWATAVLVALRAAETRPGRQAEVAFQIFNGKSRGAHAVVSRDAASLLPPGLAAVAALQPGLDAPGVAGVQAACRAAGVALHRQVMGSSILPHVCGFLAVTEAYVSVGSQFRPPPESGLVVTRAVHVVPESRTLVFGSEALHAAAGQYDANATV